MWRKQRRRQGAQARKRTRLVLEALEGRTLLSAPLEVINLNDSGPGSLRAAIAAANQTSGAAITFAQDLAGQTITLTSGELLITSSMTITGLTDSNGGPDILIDGNLTSRVFDIESSDPIDVSLNGLSIANGFARPDAPTVGGAGGGLLINNAAGAVTLDNVNVSNNLVAGATGSGGRHGQTALGAGISFNLFGTNPSAKLVIEDSTISANEGFGGQGGRGIDSTVSSHFYTGGAGGNAFGGGLYVGVGSVKLSNDSLVDNFLDGGRGGQGGHNFPSFERGGVGGTAFGAGLYVAGGSVTLSGGALANNLAQGGTGGTATNLGALNTSSAGAGGSASGGGLYVAGGSVSLSNARVANNSVQTGSSGSGVLDADTSGGGLDVAAGGAATLTKTTLSGNSAIEGGAISNQGALTLSGGMINNNTAQGSDQFAVEGGGIFNQGTLTLTGVMVENNTVTSGHNGGNGTAKHPQGFQGASAAGGGIYSSGGSLNFQDSTFQSNQVIAANGGIGINVQTKSGASIGHTGGAGGNALGGALYVAGGSVSLSSDTLADNILRAGLGGHGVTNLKPDGADGVGGIGGNAFGGALYVATGTVTLSNDTLAGNQALGGRGGDGGNAVPGGQFAQAAYGGNGGNASGGGVYVASGIVSLSNDTLADNRNEAGNGGSAGKGTIAGGGNGGSVSGGGLFVAGGSVSLVNDTLAQNRNTAGNAGSNGSNTNRLTFGGNAAGGGLFAPGGTLTLADTLIAQNSIQAGAGIIFQKGPGLTRGSAAGPDVAGAIASSDHDLIGDTSGSSGFSAANGDILNVNPALGPLQSNGGPTQTRTLLPGSPAIDKGDSTTAGLPATDQRGFARIIGQAVDIGAVEYQYDLAISGSAPSSVQGGQTITYQITVTNNGPDIAGNGGGVVLTDVLPSGVGFQSITAPSGWSASNQGHTITVTIPTLAAGASANFTLVVQTSNSTPPTVANTVVIGPTTWDTLTGNNSVTFTTTVTPAIINVSNDVSVTRSGFRYDFVHHEFVQTITITNTSGNTLFGPLALQLTNLSSNATLANASGTYNGDPYIDFLSAGQSLAPGQSITVTLYFKDPTFQSITYGTEVLQGI